MTKLEASAKSMFTCCTSSLYYIHALLDTSPKVSSHFFDASQKEHRLSTISFCYGEDMFGCKQTGKQRWYMLLQTNSTAPILTRDIIKAEIEACESC
jgi:hypothetical protein